VSTNNEEVQECHPSEQFMEEHNKVVEEASVNGEGKEDVHKMNIAELMSQEDLSSSQNLHSEDVGAIDSASMNSVLDISHVPVMVAHATSDFTRSTVVNNFLKGCKWYDND